MIIIFYSIIFLFLLAFVFHCIYYVTEPKGQLLLIDGKTEDEVCRSLERVVLTMKTTTSEPKVMHIVQSFDIDLLSETHGNVRAPFISLVGFFS